jgi:Papain-like cysteine protease AvrRpt2
MTVPIMYSAPRVVTQTAETCWAQAFESWHDANAELFDSPPCPFDAQRLIDIFNSEGLLYRNLRARPQGMTLMAGIGFMRLQPYHAPYVSIRVLGYFLQDGYLYLAYWSRAGRAAHAVVCYGVDSQNIYLMDPMPGAGLITVAPSYFMQMRHGIVVIGTTWLGDLTRGVRDALAPLQQGP